MNILLQRKYEKKAKSYLNYFMETDDDPLAKQYIEKLREFIETYDYIPIQLVHTYSEFDDITNGDNFKILLIDNNIVFYFAQDNVDYDNESEAGDKEIIIDIKRPREYVNRLLNKIVQTNAKIVYHSVQEEEVLSIFDKNNIKILDVYDDNLTGYIEFSLSELFE